MTLTYIRERTARLRMQCLQLSAAAALALALLPSTSHGVADTERHACDAWLDARSLRDPAAFHAPQPGLGCFDGKIALDTVAPLIDWLTQQTPARSVLVIRSPGGDVKAGLQIGRRLLEARSKVYARDMCASSCANYVFMLGREPEALPDSLILYHGGITPELIAEMTEMARSQLSTMDPQVAEREIKRLTSDAEAQLTEQRKLFADAGLRASFLERFGLAQVAAMAAKDCTPGAAGKPNGFLVLTKQQHQKVGVQPMGEMVDMERVSVLLERPGNEKLGVCAAPAVLFE